MQGLVVGLSWTRTAHQGLSRLKIRPPKCGQPIRAFVPTGCRPRCLNGIELESKMMLACIQMHQTSALRLEVWVIRILHFAHIGCNDQWMTCFATKTQAGAIDIYPSELIPQTSWDLAVVTCCNHGNAEDFVRFSHVFRWYPTSYSREYKILKTKKLTMRPGHEVCGESVVWQWFIDDDWWPGFTEFRSPCFLFFCSILYPYHICMNVDGATERYELIILPGVIQEQRRSKGRYLQSTVQVI